jgi:pimeloyl-ACP methyl ester carboxylesterase
MSEPNDWSQLQVRVHGGPEKPTLIYFPGLHGDWTLVTSFRIALEQRVRFVEFTYPRTETWSVRDHAKAIFAALEKHNVNEGWILAESFGSVLAWAVLELAPQREFTVHGIILAGGFVRYPIMPLVRFAQCINRLVPMWVIRTFCWFYARYANLRHRNAPETFQAIDEFVRRRTEPADRDAICHRYTLIRESDARDIAARATIPMYQLCGLFDPIVLRRLVSRWLQRHCRTYRGCRVITKADHNVLGTAPKAAAEQVLMWMGVSE